MKIFMKRTFDFCVSLFLLILLSPVLAVIALVILIDDGAPVIFRQKRVGRNAENFEIIKFRTMKKGTRNAATANLSEADEQITRSGRILRKTSLDELLQLVNVLNGSMSLVGPRPLIPEETDIHELRLKYGVYSVRPGVTGWAQINGRDNLSAKEKALFDKEYIDKQSLLFDIKILIRTVSVVLRRENISEGGNQA